MATTLTDRLSRLVKTMRGQARITESNVQDMLREVRMALLEADVALPVVREFIARVKSQALGQDVVGSLNPGQALVGIVHKELAATMGAGTADLNLATQPPAVILMAGLQGAGKTTTTAKLARHLIERRKKKVLTVSSDVYRPAAIEQLRVVSQQAGAEVVRIELSEALAAAPAALAQGIAQALLGTVLQFATFGTLPDLDEKGRPRFAYGRTIHEHCPRRAHFDAGRFAEKYGDEGHRLVGMERGGGDEVVVVPLARSSESP